MPKRGESKRRELDFKRSLTKKRDSERKKPHEQRQWKRPESSAKKC